jgi:hypothetical protein
MDAILRLLPDLGSGCLVMGLIFIVALFLGFVREWIVRGSEYRRALARAEKWENLAIPGLQMASNLTSAVKSEIAS